VAKKKKRKKELIKRNGGNGEAADVFSGQPVLAMLISRAAYYVVLIVA